MFRKMFPILLILTLALSACNFKIIMPPPQKTGATVIDQINVPLPSGTTRMLR